MKNNNSSLRQVTSGSKHHFFGFYDTSPWDGSGRYLLTLRVDFIHRAPTSEDEAEVCLIDTEKEMVRQLATSSAWNFQQGARLQWIGPDYTPWIAFNDCEEDTLVTRFLNIKTKETRTLQPPLFTVGPNGDLAVSINFNRGREGYGYSGDSFQRTQSPNTSRSEDGIRIVTLPEGESSTLISFAELCDILPLDTMNTGHHWIDHVRFDPTGSKIAFLHRWTLQDGGMYTRLLVATVDGETIDCVIDSGRVTHYDWRTSEQLIAWSRHQDTIKTVTKDSRFQNPIQRLVLNSARAVIKRVGIPSWFQQNVIGEGYYLYDLTGGDQSRIATGKLNRDGHPSVAPHDPDWIVTDTYPDADSNRHLWLYNIESEQRIELGSFHSPTEYNGTGLRCDLHPRWNRTGTHICFDSMHQNGRQLYVMDIAEYVK